ncbi:unnamed protein product [Gordionus sp. m RMFG-2023]
MESYYYRAFKLSPYRTYAQPPIFDGSENGLKLSINRYARHSKETSLDFSVDNAIIESSYRIPNISPVHKSRGGCADCKGLINDNYIEHLKIFYQILQEEENELLPPVSDNKVNKRNEMNMIEPPYKYIQPTTAAMPRSFFKRPDTPYNFDRSIDRFSSGAQSAESLEKNVGVQRVSRPKSLDKHTSTVQNVSVFTNEEPGLDKVTEGFKPDIPPAYAIQEGAPIKNSSQHIAQSPKKLTSTPKNMSAGFSSDVSLPSSNTSQFKIAKETEVQTKFQLPNHPTLTSQEQFDVINKSKKLGNFKMKKPHIGSNIVIKTLPSANTKTV